MSHNNDTKDISTQAIFQAERNNLLNLFLLSMAVLTTIGFTVVLTLRFLSLSAPPIPPFAPVIAILVWVLALVRQIPYQLRAGMFIALLFGSVIQELFIAGIISNASLFAIAFIVSTLVFFGFRAAVVTAALTGVTLGIIGWQTQIGNLTFDPETIQGIVSGSDWPTITILFAVGAIILLIIAHRLLKNTQEALNRQQALVEALQKERESLETQVEEQTHTLQLAAQINRTLTTALDRNQLISEVVEQIQTAFNYYHVQVYLLDESRQELRLIGGTGEAGRALLMGNHKLKLHQGLVGQAARINAPVIISSVVQDSAWVANPLLPETQSEIAVPITLEGQVIGVLDVQQNQAKALSHEDADLLESIGNQIGIALRNAELYEKAVRRAQQQGFINQIGRKVQLSPTPETTLRIATEELGQVLRVPQVSIAVDLNLLSKDNTKQQVEVSE